MGANSQLYRLSQNENIISITEAAHQLNKVMEIMKCPYGTVQLVCIYFTFASNIPYF